VSCNVFVDSVSTVYIIYIYIYIYIYEFVFTYIHIHIYIYICKLPVRIPSLVSRVDVLVVVNAAWTPWSGVMLR